MSEVTQRIKELEAHIEGQKTLAEMGEIAERLAANHDFRVLILDGFCRDEAARYVQESGDPMLTAVQRQDALNMAQASGHLKRFLSITCVIGHGAQDSILNAQAEIEQLRSEA